MSGGRYRKIQEENVLWSRHVCWSAVNVSLFFVVAIYVQYCTSPGEGWVFKTRNKVTWSRCRISQACSLRSDLDFKYQTVWTFMRITLASEVWTLKHRMDMVQLFNTLVTVHMVSGVTGEWWQVVESITDQGNMGGSGIHVQLSSHADLTPSGCCGQEWLLFGIQANFKVARLCIYKNLILQLCLQRWELNNYREKKYKLSKDMETVLTRSEHFTYFGSCMYSWGAIYFWSSRIMVDRSWISLCQWNYAGPF